ncbi:EamA family transporter, partial [bacterium]|nr:EamA family transporter [bacterium]
MGTVRPVLRDIRRVGHLLLCLAQAPAELAGGPSRLGRPVPDSGSLDRSGVCSGPGVVRYDRLRRDDLREGSRRGPLPSSDPILDRRGRGNPGPPLFVYPRHGSHTAPPHACPVPSGASLHRPFPVRHGVQPGAPEARAGTSVVKSPTLSDPRAEGLLLLCVLIWGANYSVSKFGISQVDPLVYNAFRYIIGAGCLLVILALGPRREPVAPR